MQRWPPRQAAFFLVPVWPSGKTRTGLTSRWGDRQGLPAGPASRPAAAFGRRKLTAARPARPLSHTSAHQPSCGVSWSAACLHSASPAATPWSAGRRRQRVRCGQHTAGGRLEGRQLTGDGRSEFSHRGRQRAGGDDLVDPVKQASVPSTSARRFVAVRHHAGHAVGEQARRPVGEGPFVAGGPGGGDGQGAGAVLAGVPELQPGDAAMLESRHGGQRPPSPLRVQLGEADEFGQRPLFAVTVGGRSQSCGVHDHDRAGTGRRRQWPRAAFPRARARAFTAEGFRGRWDASISPVSHKGRASRPPSAPADGGACCVCRPMCVRDGIRAARGAVVVACSL